MLYLTFHLVFYKIYLGKLFSLHLTFSVHATIAESNLLMNEVLFVVFIHSSEMAGVVHLRVSTIIGCVSSLTLQFVLFFAMQNVRYLN